MTATGSDFVYRTSAKVGSCEIRNSNGAVLHTVEGNCLKGAFVAKAPHKFASRKSASVKSAPVRSAPRRSAPLRYANLSWACCQNASLKSTTFDGACLPHVDFTGAIVDQSAKPTFRGAALPDAKFTKLKLVGVDFHGADLRRASFAGASLANCVLSNADLRGANFEGANLHNIRIDCAILYRTDLSKVQHLSVQWPTQGSAEFDRSTTWPSFSMARLFAINWQFELLIVAGVATLFMIPYCLLGLLVSILTWGGNPAWLATMLNISTVIAASFSLTTFVVRMYRFLAGRVTYESAVGAEGGAIDAGCFWDSNRGGTLISLQRSSASAEQLLIDLQALCTERRLRPIEIDLSWTNFTDSQLAKLSRIPGVSYLNVARSRVSAEGVAAYRAAQPDCRFVADDC